MKACTGLTVNLSLLGILNSFEMNRLLELYQVLSLGFVWLTYNKAGMTGASIGFMLLGKTKQKTVHQIETNKPLVSTFSLQNGRRGN